MMPQMERRKQTRVAVDSRTTVTILDDSPVDLPATIADFSGTGMRLWLSQPIPLSSVVQVEFRNTLYFGEVCYCFPERNGYRVGLALEQVLTVTSDLARLMEALREPEMVAS
jgi:hypothetical protein